MVKIFSGALLVLALTAANAAGADALTISRFLDNLYRSSAGTASAEMHVVTPHYERTLKMKMWWRGLDDTLIRILYPPKEKGIASLKRGREMWNYLPKIKKTIRVPPSMMMSSWMGSDLTNDDLVRHTSWERDFEVSLMENPPPGMEAVVYIPREDAAVTWSKVVGYFDAVTYLPGSIEYFDEKGRKARIMEFSDIGPLGGRKLPRRIAVVPLTEDKKGMRTVIRYEEASFDIKLPDDFFNISKLTEDF